MISRLLHKPLKIKNSFFLFGPRATGKTSWLKSQFTNSLYIDLLDFQTYKQLLNNPSRLREFIPPNNKKIIIIDEIQRIPELLNEVHRLIEIEKYQFALTGSSARSLRKKGINLLGGRALQFNMYPLTPEELKNKFSLEKSLKYGLLPSILHESNPKEYLKSYINTYLKEEVLQEGLTRNISWFSNFLEVASFSQGQILNKSNIARESDIPQRTISNYFDILNDLLIAFEIPVFTKKAKRKILKHPKFFFFDVGVYRALRPRGILDDASELDGPAIETLFIQIARAINEYYGLEYNFYYWRTVNGVEVDFIIYGPKGFFAIEIKKSANVSKFDLKGLKSFRQDYPYAKPILIYGGRQNLYIDDIEVLPLEFVLKNMHEILTSYSLNSISQLS